MTMLMKLFGAFVALCTISSAFAADYAVAKIGETVYIDVENGKYVSDPLVNYGGEDLVLRAYLDRRGIGLSAASLFGEGTYLLNFASFREGFATSKMAELFAGGDAETVAEITEAVGELEKMLDAALTKTEAANDALKNEMLSLLAIENETGTKKVGAMLGDFVEVGCNSVLNPGTVIGRNSSVYPTSCVRGVVPENSIYKKNDTIVTKK